MITGMMWYDNDPKTTLSQKILAAAQYYRLKYGVIIDTVIVNPKMLEGQEYDPEHVKSMKYILPGHLWIGREEKNKVEALHET
jgi:hypothetical protein